MGEKNGVAFVDDSKATTVEALRAAILSFKQPVRLLCGGVYKGGDLKALLPDMVGKVKAVGLFGASREIFEDVITSYSIHYTKLYERAPGPG